MPVNQRAASAIRIGLFSLGIVLGCIGSAFGQSGEFKKMEIFGSAGWNRIQDGRGSLGTGSSSGFGLGFFVKPKVALDFDLTHTDHSVALPSGTQVRRSFGTTNLGFINVSYYFNETALGEREMRPYLTGGIGELRSVRTDNLGQGTIRGSQFGTPSYSEQLISSERITIKEAAGNVGAGLDVALNSWVSVRPEFRFFAAPSQAMVRASGLLVFRW